MNILIVDDHPTNLKVLRAVLEAEGHAVLAAGDGLEALNLLKREPVDAIISDILMPGMDGYRLCHEVRNSERFRHLPFIFYTATYISEGDEKLCYDIGGDRYLRKPASSKTILAALHEVANSSRRPRPPLAPQMEAAVMKEYSAQLVSKLEEKSAELSETVERLRASELHFRQMAEAIRDVFFLVAADSGRMFYVSPAYEEIWGRSSESLYADPESWAEAIHPDDRAAAYENYRKGMSTGQFEYEYRIVRPDGSIRHIEVRGFPVHDDTGKLVRIAGVAEDVTERKAAEQELRESERRFGNMLANVDLVALMLDGNARITYCNDFLLRLTGWQRTDVIGRDWFELFIPPAENADMKRVFADLLSDLPSAWHHENEILTRTEELRLIRWNNTVLRSGSGQAIGTASVGEDITERRQAERIKQKRAEDLEQFHRLSVGRELQMIELKKEVNELARQAGRPAPYDLSFLEREPAGTPGRHD